MTPEELKALRADHGLTQRHAAELAWVTTRTYQNWESGKYSIPPNREKLLRDAVRRIAELNSSKERK